MVKVIVIGAGMGGMSAAIRLQNEGYQVEIYEQQAIPGGKMSQIKAEGHTFDVGPTIVMWPEAYREVFELAGRDPDDYIPMKRLEPMYDVFFKGDPYRKYSLSSDLTKMMKLAESKGPETALGFLRYLTEIYERYQVAEKDFIRRPFRHKRDMYNPYMLRQAMKLKTFDSANKMMATFIPDEDLQQMMAFQTLYIGVSPQSGPSLYNMIPMIELFYGVYFLDGGMHSMAQGMARLFQELGGIIHYNSPVEEIVVERQKAKGIRVAGELVEADYVISNADFPYTMKHLMKDEKARGKYTPEKIDSMDYSCSCLVFYWGVEGKYDDLATHSFIISEDLDDNLNRIFDGRLMDDPSIYLHIPSNTDPSMAPEGKSSFYLLMPTSDIVQAQYEYNKETIDHYRERALRTLEKLPELKNLRESITMERIVSPLDFEKNFSAYRGSTFGLQPSLRQSNHWRPQSKSLDCEGLYFTGSSTHPGAGVPTAIEGGRICADELILDDTGE